jgi:hypothetical protein
MICINANCQRKATRLMASVTRNGINSYCGFCCRSFCDYISSEYSNETDVEPVVEVFSKSDFIEVGYHPSLPIICFYKLKKGEVLE